ncbi:uncharacterized protein [Mytilus edulis]|uniref:uncharacterized protein n=1 Tax=Mytilus edulis TaxID=6550 RepID=UPI0039F0DFCF
MATVDTDMENEAAVESDIVDVSLNSVDGLPGQSNVSALEGSILVINSPKCSSTPTKEVNEGLPGQSNVSALEGSILVISSPKCSSTPKKKVNEAKHVCEKCGKMFTSPSGRKDHFVRVHDDKPRYRCSTCSQGFMTRTLYLSHVLMHGKVNSEL